MTTFTQILYQIVFGSKKRISFFNEDNQTPLFNYIAGISSNKRCYPYRIGGDSNHIHMIIELHKTIGLSNFVKDVKIASNLWIQERKEIYPNFRDWQVGFSAFTYDLSALENLKRYVDNQNDHHRIKTFEEEYIALLVEHGIEFDEHYVWD